MKISFLGGSGTVTGSKHLLEHGGRHILLDCGLFQGFKNLRLRNRAEFAIPPRMLDAVVLSHAHLDHSGWLPALVRDGYRGPIHASAATCALARVLLLDSARLQEEEAEYANRKGYAKHQPALPLYTIEDAERALTQFTPLPWHTNIDLLPGMALMLRRAGHILGAALVEIGYEGKSLVFTGDLGRSNDVLMLPPERIEQTDTLLIESTYGDRVHPPVDAAAVLADVIGRTIARHGTVVIPAFAVGRAQALLVELGRLKRDERIPGVPIYLNSPMAAEATRLYQQFPDEHRLSEEECRHLHRVAKIVTTVDDSKALNLNRQPKVILSASGMATGGRVLHHLKAFAPDPKNTLLFSGFQSGGSRGALIVGGAASVRIHGDDVPIRAEVHAMEELSSHADSNELMDWMRGFQRPPQRSFIVHGEPGAADALRRRIAAELKWRVDVPDYRDEVALD
jgi:metallo-beta-lactamase family protein